MHEVWTKGLVNYALKRGGSIHPLIIDSHETGGTGLMNPSVFVDGEKVLINVRHTNYTLYHSENGKFPHQYGSLQYIHPEDDITLRTNNFICHLDEDLSVEQSFKVDMKLDEKPLWHFIGLEDARLFRWDNRLFLCGVRRDHLDAKGKGRMDISEIEFDGSNYIEKTRNHIPAPAPNNTYCEKNWMPVMDMPFRWVKWCNPTEVVRYDPDTLETVTETLDGSKVYDLKRDLRGGSQVVSVGDRRIAITHEVSLYNDLTGRKDGRYFHRVVVWDKDWNIIHTTSDFSFMSGGIEFCTGLAFHKGNALLSFGYQDNAAYILKLPEDVFFDFVKNGVRREL